MPTRRGYKRPTTTKPTTPKKTYVAPLGKNSPNAIIRLASGAPYKATKTRVRGGRGAGRTR